MNTKKILLLVTFWFFSFTAFAQNDTRDPLQMFDWKPMAEAQKLASEDGKKVLIYGNARWCSYCKKMEKEVFSLEKVQEKTEEYFHSVWLNIESQDSLTFRGQTITHRQFAQGLRITGTPTFIFLDSEGEIIAGQPGFIPEELYLQILEYVGTDAYLKQKFDEFTGTSGQ